jgi:hypothetical protein
MEPRNLFHGRGRLCGLGLVPRRSLVRRPAAGEAGDESG